LVAQVWPRDSPSRLTHEVRRPNGRCISTSIVTHSLHFPLDVIIRTTCLNVRFPFFRYLPLRIYVSFLFPSSFFLLSLPSSVSLFPPRTPYSPLLLHLRLWMACDSYVEEPHETHIGVSIIKSVIFHSCISLHTLSFSSAMSVLMRCRYFVQKD